MPEQKTEPEIRYAVVYQGRVLSIHEQRRSAEIEAACRKKCTVEEVST
jgi:hypothetical protein